MDFSYLFNILLRRKWLLLSVILLSACATWFLVGLLPPVYKSKSVISTGIIDYKGVSLQKDNPFIQKFQIESSFNGLIEKMKSRLTVKLLTDQLLLHDLQADGIQVKSFREPKQEEDGVTAAELQNYVQKLKTSNPDTVVNVKPQVEQYNNRIAEAFKYDYESLLKKLDINRIGETDYLSVEFKSESPELSYFAVKTFLEEFFKLHESDLSHEKNIALKFHTSQVDSRKKDLDAKIEEINQYKKSNNLIDVSTQRESVINHLKDLEMKREEEAQKIPALKSSIAILNQQIMKYNKVNSGDFASLVFAGEDFVEIDGQLQQLQEKYIEQIAAGNKNLSALEKQIEALKTRQSQLIRQTPALTTNNNKERIQDRVQDWIMESLQKQLDLEFAQEAVRSYEAEIVKQQGRAGKLLLDDNHLTTLESEKERLEKEYLRATEEYDKAKLYAEGTENPLSVVEPAELPDKPEPSHRSIFAAFAGVASGTLASVILFLLAIVDSSLQSPSQFQRVTKLPLLGYVNRVRVKNLNLQHLFAHVQKQEELEIFKENIRKLRTAIENSGGKSFLFVSPKEQEGKSFLIVLLAYALSLNQKRILLIDTNFKNNTLSGFKTKSFIEISTDPGTPLKGIGNGYKELGSPAYGGESDPLLKNIDIVGNKGGNQSPSEVLAGKDFKKILRQYGQKYDFIFLEAAAANKFSDARELAHYVDKVVAVFSTQFSIGAADKDTFEFLRNLNGRMLGGILNNVDLKNL